MFCKCVLVFLLSVLLCLRWRSDVRLSSRPWLVFWRGSSALMPGSGVLLSFGPMSGKYGDPLLIFYGVHRLRERSELEVHVSCGVRGPADSEHRLCILMNDKPIRTIDIRINKLGITHAESLLRVILPAGARMTFVHYYDHMGAKHQQAQATCDIAFRSGIPNIYDAPWVYNQ